MKKLLIALIVLGGIGSMAEARRCNSCKPKCEKKCDTCKPKCNPCGRRCCVEKTCDATKEVTYCAENTCDIAERPCCYTNHQEVCTWKQYHPASKHTVVTYTCPNGTSEQTRDAAPEEAKIV